MLFFLKLLFCFHASNAQMPPKENASSTDQLVVALGIDKKIQRSLEEGESFFIRSQTYQNDKTKTLEAKISARAKASYDKEKLKLKSEMLTKVSSELNSRFTEAEKKYLIDASKYSVMTKLLSFFDSSEYQISTNIPVNRAMELTRKARLEIKIEEKMALQKALPKNNLNFGK